MSRVAARFTQADMRRAIAANEAAGAKSIVEVGPDGVIRVIPAHLVPALNPENQNKRLPDFDAYDENRPVM